MAKKISQLTQATQVKSDDVTVIVQDGETKKLPLNMMVTKQDIENKKVAGLAKLDEIEATYENDTYTPTITVKNKSSVKVGEGDGVDYSANVMDGPAKSAILSGQTLVNCISFETSANQENRYITYYKESVPLIGGKKYLIYLPNFNDLTLNVDIYTSSTKQWKRIITCNSKVVVFQAQDDEYIRNCFGYISSNHVSIEPTKNMMVLEYQEGMENWDIPYFEGMKSVKMPVLKTTGKNLIDLKNAFSSRCTIDTSNNTITGTDSYNDVQFYVTLEKGKTYRFSANGEYSATSKILLGRCQGYVGDKEIQSLNINNEFTYLGETGEHTLHIIYFKDVVSNIQLEEGSTPTPYEPYKSNILTVNEDVTLRGIGDVKDELNLLTGELTQRVGEVVLDGNAGWGEYNGNYYVSLPGVQAGEKLPWGKVTILSNLYPSFIGEETDVYIASGWNGNQIKIRDVNLSLEELKSKLMTQPLVATYISNEELVKTVDLMPSGTHPSTTPYCWKNGHIQLSSSGLLPNLEYSVVTSRAGQINQNATMIVKNDKRIFDLEILLAGGLVNTTYQALTLQNQVETGLSKVSLSSEKEPDYLLYHMIMKLIEEKAYKLDDLTEKVSVFYLYEKLSDEQFETIYSALYPFVEDEYFESDIPGDDEVIEEPIVDESLEEVEDEVVM